MTRAFGLILMLVALYFGMKIYADGADHAFGGMFAPLESVNNRETPLATHLTPLAQGVDEPAPPPQRRVRITDAVRERVQSDIDKGARRRGY